DLPCYRRSRHHLLVPRVAVAPARVTPLCGNRGGSLNLGGDLSADLCLDAVYEPLLDGGEQGDHRKPPCGTGRRTGRGFVASRALRTRAARRARLLAPYALGAFLRPLRRYSHHATTAARPVTAFPPAHTQSPWRAPRATPATAADSHPAKKALRLLRSR